MVNVTVIEKKNNWESIIEIDGKRISLKDYSWLNGEVNGYKKCHYDNIPGLDDDVINKYRKNIDWNDTPILKDENGQPVLDEKGMVIYTEDEWIEGLKEFKKSNRNLWAEIHSAEWESKREEAKSRGFWSLNDAWLNLNDNLKKIKEAIERNNKLWSDNLDFYKKEASYCELLKKSREDWKNKDKDKDREKRNREAAELESSRNQAKEVINKALQEEPQVPNNELSDSSWEGALWHAINEHQVNEIKEGVLADISIKREAKKVAQGKRNEWEKTVDEAKIKALKEISATLQSTRLVAGDLSADCQNWQEQINQAGESVTKIEDIQKKVLADIKNKKEVKDRELENRKNQAKIAAQEFGKKTKGDVEKMKDEELEKNMKLFVSWEGEGELKSSETISQIEEKLMKSNPELYKETIIKALQERINNYGISMNDLDEETKKIIRGKLPMLI